MKQSKLGQFFDKKYPNGIVPATAIIPNANPTKPSTPVATIAPQQQSPFAVSNNALLIKSPPGQTSNGRSSSTNSSASKPISDKKQQHQPVKLNASDEQLRIINESKQSHIQIKACAGSGKTTTILQRVKHLIESEHVRPNRILITAFNVDAAKSVKQKLHRLLCDDRIEKQISVNNIDKLSKQWVIAARRYNVDTLSVSEFTAKLVTILSSDAAFCKHITGQFDYIFFDEFQDINPEEYELLKIFATNSTVITLVGDDAQNIYGFREAKVAVTAAQLESDFPGIKHHSLTTNYRSLDPIVQFANNVLANSKIQQLNEMRMKPSPEHSKNPPEIVTASTASDAAAAAVPTKKKMQNYQKKPEFTKFMSITEQNDAIISHVLEFIEMGIPLDQIAVLSRMNKPLQFLEEELEKYNSRITKAASTQSLKVSSANLFKQAQLKQKHVLIPYVAHISDNKDKQGHMKFKNQDGKSKNNNNSSSTLQTTLTNPAGSNPSTSTSSQRLTLTTIHKAKGLEWDVVFLIGLNDDFFPGTNKEKELEEERRVFYVGVTRARRFLEMSFIWSKKAQNATRFVAEIPNDFYSGYTPPLISDQLRCNEQMRMIDKLKSKTVLLSETLEFLTKDHYEELRNLGCLDAIQKDSKQIHFKCSLGQYIIENNLVVEFANFFKSYILRSISEEILLHSASAAENSNSESGQESSESHSYLNGFHSKFCQQVLFAQAIIMTNGSVSLPATRIDVDFAKDSRLMSSLYVSEQAKREEILRSLAMFQDRSKKSDSILKSIFNVAMCSSIVNQRKRLLHKDDAFKHFEMNKNILLNAKKSFLPEVFRSYPTMPASMNKHATTQSNSKETRLITLENIALNESLYSEEFQFKADFDLITHDTIFEIRFAQTLQHKPEDTIELLAKAGILESTWKVNVRYLVVYYPLQGELVTLDILGHNDKLNAILKVLYSARQDKQEACSVGTKSPSSAHSSQVNKLNMSSASNEGDKSMIEWNQKKSNFSYTEQRKAPTYEEEMEDYYEDNQTESIQNYGKSKQSSLYDRYGEDSYADMCEDYEYDQRQNAKRQPAFNQKFYTQNMGRFNLAGSTTQFSGMARGLQEKKEASTGISSGFTTAAATFARTQSIGGSQNSFISAASMSASVTPQPPASSQNKPLLQRKQSNGMMSSVSLFQQSKKLNNFNRSNNASQNSYETNSNSGSFDYGSGEECGGNKNERQSNNRHENAVSREEEDQDDQEIEESGVINQMKPFGGAGAGFIKASDIAGTKQSIQTKKSNSQKLKVFNDVALMNKISKPMIGGKAVAATLTKADSYEQFKYSHGQYKRKESDDRLF